MQYNPMKPGVADLTGLSDLLEGKSEDDLQATSQRLADTIISGLDQRLSTLTGISPAQELLRRALVTMVAARLSAYALDESCSTPEEFAEALDILCVCVRAYSANS